MKTKVKRFLISLLLFTLILVMSLFFFSQNYYNNSGPLGQNTNIIIKPGTSLINISKELGSANIIKYPYLFVLIAKISNLSDRIQAGEYEFTREISPKSVLKKMASGKTFVRKLTIPEGFTVSQILKIINEDSYLVGEINIPVNEGELLPETYNYSYGDNRNKIIQRMKDSMTGLLDKVWEERVPNELIKTKNDVIIFASIIEKETALDSEREKIAGVFLNRLKKNMLLQTDPTVIYALTKGEYVLNRSLTREDLNIDSPYNTYRKLGLPPMPIASPGKKSILAALHPEENNLLYFVADGNGGHNFASSLLEHNKNVILWRKKNIVDQ